MKKIILGITLFVSGVLGILTSLLTSAIMIETFGKLNESTSIQTYIDWFGITPYCILSIFLIFIGIAISIKEAYFTNKVH